MSSKGSVLFSIRTKYTAMILIFIAALMLSVLGLVNRSVSEVVLEQSLAKAIAVARGVAAASDDPLLTGDDLALFTVIKGVIENEGILYGMIVGNDDTVKAHSDISKSHVKYREPADGELLKEGRDYKVSFYTDPSRGFVYDVAVPIVSVRVKEGFGVVHIGISRRFIDEAVQRVNRYIKYLSIIGLFIGGIGALIITGFIVKPVHVLVKSAKAIGGGDLEHRIKVNRRDELGELMEAFNEMADGLKQKQVIQESFGRYVAPEVLDMILKNEETWFKGKKVDVTVLFADIRGFTSFSEHRDPSEVIDMLNEYFTLMTKVVQRHQGYVDKFIGDAIMVIFGSPVHYDGHALQAARAACEMQEKLKGMNKGRAEADYFHIGIGVNTGEVVAGNLGSIQKMEYAVIGDGVNTSSRLCSAAAKSEIIISKSTYDEIKESDFAYKALEPISVKGKVDKIEIYSLFPRRSPERRDDAGPEGRRG
jgi:adenylate cyclase